MKGITEARTEHLPDNLSDIASSLIAQGTQFTIHNRILSKVCYNVFTCGIRSTCNNQCMSVTFYYEPWSGPWLITESYSVS